MAFLYLGENICFTFVPHSPTQKDPVNAALEPLWRAGRENPYAAGGQELLSPGASGSSVLERLAVGDLGPAGRASHFSSVRQQRDSGCDSICSVRKCWMCLNKQVMKATLISKGLRKFREFSPQHTPPNSVWNMSLPRKASPLTGSFIRSAFLLGFVTPARTEEFRSLVDKSQLNEWVLEVWRVFSLGREGRGLRGAGHPRQQSCP